MLRRQQRAEAKNSAILDAALRLFSRFGLHGTTVDQIAEAANVSKTNLFYYFASKEDVYVAVLQRLLDEWLGAVPRHRDRLGPGGCHLRICAPEDRIFPNQSRSVAAVLPRDRAWCAADRR